MKAAGIVALAGAAVLSLAAILMPPGATAQEGTLKEGTFVCGYGKVPPKHPKAGTAYAKRCCRTCVRRADGSPAAPCLEWRVTRGRCPSGK